jgi:ribosomal-protein-alanine N-acetyltransferase
MTEALVCALDFAFERLGLHRVEAACLPSNAASKGLLLKVGFTQEGYTRRYLRINGDWRDHLLFGILREDPRARSQP